MLRICSAFVSALLVLAPLGVGANTVSGKVEVHDGDDLIVGGARIRLYGIDAPERSQHCQTEHGLAWACGAEVRQRLIQRYAGKEAKCERHGVGRYGRDLGVCFVEGENVNGWLVSTGWAFAFRKYSMMFDQAERAAMAERRGLHAISYQAPSVYRQIQRSSSIASVAETAPSTNCQIKGNISRTSDEKIYHVPGQRNYADTVIRMDRGERWFCSPAEAEAKGWRAAKR